MYELLCQNRKDGKTYDITQLAGSIQYKTYLKEQAGLLTFTVEQDPNNSLQMSNGSIISFRKDNENIFWGYIFTMGTDATGVYKITCYDQIRYLKNEEIYKTVNQTADQIFEQVCLDTELKYNVKSRSNFVLPPKMHTKETLYSVIQYGIDRAIINDNKQYFIRDNYGTLEFTDLGLEKTNLIIGDGSLLTSYQYEISIDKDTYNQIKLFIENDKLPTIKSYITPPTDSMKFWGKLQLVQAADKNTYVETDNGLTINEALIRDKAQLLLDQKDRETTTMKLTAIGIDGLNAGNGFTFVLSKLNLKKDMWITQATHNYSKYFHTMELEVFI